LFYTTTYYPNESTNKVLVAPTSLLRNTDKILLPFIIQGESVISCCTSTVRSLERSRQVVTKTDRLQAGLVEDCMDEAAILAAVTTLNEIDGWSANESA